MHKLFNIAVAILPLRWKIPTRQAQMRYMRLKKQLINNITFPLFRREA